MKTSRGSWAVVVVGAGLVSLAPLQAARAEQWAAMYQNVKDPTPSTRVAGKTIPFAVIQDGSSWKLGLRQLWNQRKEQAAWVTRWHPQGTQRPRPGEIPFAIVEGQIGVRVPVVSPGRVTWTVSSRLVASRTEELPMGEVPFAITQQGNSWKVWLRKGSAGESHRWVIRRFESPKLVGPSGVWLSKDGEVPFAVVKANGGWQYWTRRPVPAPTATPKPGRQPEPTPSPTPKPDSSPTPAATPTPEPWVKLGAREVALSADKDEIPVGVKDATFRHIKLKVTGNPVHVIQLKVYFTTGEVHRIWIRKKVAEGGETGASWPKAHGIQKVQVRYHPQSKTQRDGKAKIELLGLPER